ncbi:MAG: hypothetical protein M1832_004380 [Thelocarpon impressellum]|nr:MAG: hypothetical protein M1832_004380 [Thelocarpon impressellum]
MGRMQLALPVLFTVAVALPVEHSQRCGCFEVSGPEPGYFQKHRFFDFRNVDPASYLESAAFTDAWSIQSWGKPVSAVAPVAVQNAPENVCIGRDGNSTHLTLKTSRSAELQSAAEINTIRQDILHASIRIKARVNGDAGAVAGMFTIAGAEESDLEILTRDPEDHIRYTNQPGSAHGATTDQAIPGRWRNWAIHRLDWFPGRSEWYFDNHRVVSKNVNCPTRPSILDLNMWGDGGEWAGPMRVGGSARLEIQWVEMAFNTSESSRRRRGPAGCGVVCSLD